MFTPSTDRNISNDINNVIPSNSQINALRDSYNADIVVIFTADAYTVNGSVHRDFEDLDEENGFAIVEVSAPLYRNTSAHEIGHIFGCKHQECDQCNFWNQGDRCGGACHNDDTRDASHAHFFRANWWPISNWKHTILDAAEDRERHLVLHYSNPAVKWNGESTGEEMVNNAAQLLNSACTVAAFRDNGQVFSVSINARTKTCPCTNFIVTAETMGAALGNTNYFWEESFDGGITFSPRAQNTFQLSIYDDCSSNAGVTVRVTATDANGNTATSTRVIQIDYDPDCDDGNPQITDGSHLTQDRVDGIALEQLTVHPNPARHEVVVNFGKTEPNKIMLYSSQGVLISERQVNELESNITFDISNLKSGFYYIHTFSKKEIITKKFLILN